MMLNLDSSAMEARYLSARLVFGTQKLLKPIEFELTQTFSPPVAVCT
jgi:hypothetical protein